jgi:hypothetical protein
VVVARSGISRRPCSHREALPRDNAERYRIFEKPSAPAPTERERTLQRRKAELARVRESLARPGLRVGMKDALRAQVRVLVKEIAALGRKGVRPTTRSSCP